MTQEEIQKAFENRWRIKGFDIYEVRQLSGESVAELCLDFFETGIILGQREYVPFSTMKVKMEMPSTPEEAATMSKVKTPLDLRAEKFCKSLNTTEYIQKYGMQLLKAFYDYWSEPNKSHTKMRFEMQPTWDLDRRLARWARNNFNRYDRQQSTDNKLEKLGSILAP